MTFDQAEIEFDEEGLEDQNEQNDHEAVGDHNTTIGTSDETFRNNLADSMFNEWNH